MNKKVSLSVSLSHPARKFQLGRHSVVREKEEYELNEKEVKELEGKGPQKWLVVHSPKFAKKPKGVKASE